MTFETIKGKADAIARWSAVLLGFSIPISTALDGVLLAIILVGFIFSGDYRERIRSVWENPVGVAALGLLALMILGLFYNGSPGHDALRYAGKYADLLFVAVLIPVFRDTKTRERAMLGFMAAMLLTLTLSFLAHWNLSPAGWAHGNAADAYVFKSHITQNILMAFAAFVFAQRGREATTGTWRAVWWLLAAAAVFNVLFMVEGRSGYLVLAALVFYFCFEWGRWKGLGVAALLTLALGGMGYYASNTLQGRVNQGIQDYREWQSGVRVETAIGYRMSFYTNTLAIIAEHPWRGHGTGTFISEYAQQIANTKMPMSNNPHNQYLLITVELGVVGLAVLLYLFFAQWRAAALLSSHNRQVARALVLTIALGGLVNSLLIDHTERLFYVWLTGLVFSELRSYAERRRQQEDEALSYHHQ
jgi:O-antigen ligase